jgi:hypothetical protein
MIEHECGNRTSLHEPLSHDIGVGHVPSVIVGRVIFMLKRPVVISVEHLDVHIIPIRDRKGRQIQMEWLDYTTSANKRDSKYNGHD